MKTKSSVVVISILITIFLLPALALAKNPGELMTKWSSQNWDIYLQYEGPNDHAFLVGVGFEILEIALDRGIEIPKQYHPGYTYKAILKKVDPIIFEEGRRRVKRLNRMKPIPNNVLKDYIKLLCRD